MSYYHNIWSRWNDILSNEHRIEPVPEELNLEKYTDPLTSSIPWATDIGHELTFTVEGTKKQWREHLNGGCSSSGTPIREKLSDYKDQFERLMTHHQLGSVDRDPGCIEVPSKVLKSWDEFIEWNQDVRHLANRCGLRNQVDYTPGGGGHHHIDRLRPNQKDFMFRILAAHPYLAWMFIHPSDRVNAVSVAQWEIARRERQWRTTGNGFDIEDYNSRYPTWKGVVLCVRKDWGLDTLEWRAFDSAVDMEMQIEHTAFLQALVKYVKVNAPSKSKSGYLFSSVQDAKNIRDSYGKSLNKSTKAFFECLKVLGLPKSRYEKYIDTHLAPRIQWGNAI